MCVCGRGQDHVHKVLKYKQNAFGMVNVLILHASVASFAKCRIHYFGYEYRTLGTASGLQLNNVNPLPFLYCHMQGRE